MAAIGKVSLRGLVHDEFQYTFLVASGTGEATISDAGVKAMSQDTNASNTVKLALDGEEIIGRLEIYEDRVLEGIVVGTISLKGGLKFMVSPHAIGTSPAEVPTLSDYLVGAVDNDGIGGYVRKATSSEISAGKCKYKVFEVAEDDSYVIAVAVK